MWLRRTGISVCALVAALPVFAQDIELQAITVDDTTEDGFFGQAVALDTGGVMKTGTSIVETPRSVSVVTSQEIAERGAQNVEDVLQYTTGVVAGEYGLDARSDWYLIRGFRPSTFHDGLQARYGFYNDTKPEPFLLDSVEVLRGPASGLYGNGEVGGVVNTSSKTSATASDNMVQMSYGSHQRKQVGVDLSGTFDDAGTLSWRLVGLARDSDAQVDYAQDNSIALAPSITWAPTANTDLTLLANVQRNDGSPQIQFASLYGTLLPSPDGRFLDDNLFIGEPGFDRFDSEQEAITAIFNHRFNNVWSMSARARRANCEADYRHAWWAFDNYPTRYNSDGTINRTFYRAENTMKTFGFDANLTADYRVANWQMQTLFGLSYSDGEYDSDYGYGANPSPIDPFNPVYTGYDPITVTDTPANYVEEYGLYVQNRATLSDRLHIDAGLRYGNIETGENTATFSTGAVNASDDAWTSNLAVLYSFDNGVAPYASYAESFRQEIVGTDANGDAFEPTRGKQFEVGVKYQPVGTNSLFTAALFDLTKSNLTRADPNNPGFSIQTGEATSRGLELSAKTYFGDLFIDANATFLDTENVDGAQVATVPDQYGSVWLGYSPSAGALEGWSFGLGARHSGAKWDGTDTQKTPAYTLYDARVGYETDTYAVSLNVNNLADKRHATFCGTATCYFGEGRTVALTASAKF